MKCSQGCDEEAQWPHPEWPEDDEQCLCTDCRIDCLEQLCDDLECDLTNYQGEIADLKRMRQKGASDENYA